MAFLFLLVLELHLFNRPLEDRRAGDQANVGGHEVWAVVVAAGQSVAQGMNQNGGSSLIDKVPRGVINGAEGIDQAKARDEQAFSPANERQCLLENGRRRCAD